MASADIELPPGWTVNDSAAVLSNNPDEIYKEYDHLRQYCPVVKVDRHNGYWLLTR
jgi:hypothetical protein